MTHQIGPFSPFLASASEAIKSYEKEENSTTSAASASGEAAGAGAPAEAAPTAAQPPDVKTIHPEILSAMDGHLQHWIMNNNEVLVLDSEKKQIYVLRMIDVDRSNPAAGKCLQKLYCSDYENSFEEILKKLSTHIFKIDKNEFFTRYPSKILPGEYPATIETLGNGVTIKRQEHLRYSYAVRAPDDTFLMSLLFTLKPPLSAMRKILEEAESFTYTKTQTHLYLGSFEPQSIVSAAYNGESKEALNTFAIMLNSLENPDDVDVLLADLSPHTLTYLFKNLELRKGPISRLFLQKLLEKARPDLSKMDELLLLVSNENFCVTPEEWEYAYEFVKTNVLSRTDKEAGEEKEDLTPIERSILKQLLNRALDHNYSQGIKSIYQLSRGKEISYDDQGRIIESRNLALIGAALDGGFKVNGSESSCFYHIFSQLEKKDILGRPVLDSKEKQKAFVDEAAVVFELFVNYGFDVNASYHSKAGLPMSLIELVSGWENGYLLMPVLLAKGATMSSRLAHKIKMRIKEHPEYAPYLIAQGKATEDEIRCLLAPQPKEGSRDSLVLAIAQIRPLLSQLSRKFAANPYRTSLVDVEKVRSLKKQIKEYLKTHEDPELKVQYNAFCLEYDAMVCSHYVLSQMQEASRDLRSIVSSHSSLSPKKQSRLMRLFSLWHPAASRIAKENSSLISTVSTDSRSATWSLLRQNLLGHWERMKHDPCLKRADLSCVHGTKLMPDMIKERAILPMGMLAQGTDGAFVTFAGEQCGSAKSLNKQHISCSRFATEWTKQTEMYREIGLLHDAATPLTTSIIYAEQESGFGDVETVFKYEESRKRVQWTFVQQAVKNKDIRSIGHICTDILRLRAWDASHSEYLFPLHEQVKAALPSVSTEEANFLSEIEHALTVKIKYPLTEGDHELITRPTPILFAASEPFHALSSVQPGSNWEEVLLKGRMQFGKEITCAFVDEKHIERIHAKLTPAGLPVYPYEVAFAIETDKMMKGEFTERLLPSGALKAAGGAGASLTPRVNYLLQLQQAIGHFIHADILPYYGMPLSEAPSYMDERGALMHVSRPFWGDVRSFAEYKKSLEETNALARVIHGKMHSVRTAMAAQMMANVFSHAKAVPIAIDRHLLAVAAAAHDAQREDEGVDYWDKASGVALYGYLASRGYPKDVCEIYSHALIEKDPKKKNESGQPIFDSEEQMCIHDADVLEIMRVLSSRSNFRCSELSFIADWEKFKHIKRASLASNPEELKAFEDHATLVESNLSKLITEWHQFIEITESSSLKMYLEYTPGLNYYQEVMKILNHVSSSGAFPMLQFYLNYELSQTSERPSSEVLALLKFLD